MITCPLPGDDGVAIDDECDEDKEDDLADRSLGHWKGVGICFVSMLELMSLLSGLLLRFLQLALYCDEYDGIKARSNASVAGDDSTKLDCGCCSTKDISLLLPYRDDIDDGGDEKGPCR